MPDQTEYKMGPPLHTTKTCDFYTTYAYNKLLLKQTRGQGVSSEQQ